MSQLTRVESLEETSFSSSIERLVGAADATLQHLASVRQTFGDLKATYCTFKDEKLEKVESEQATQVCALEAQLQSATKQRGIYQLGESRKELGENNEVHFMLSKDLCEVRKEASALDSKREIAPKIGQLRKLEAENKDLVSKVEDLKEQLSKQGMSIELHATQSKVVGTEMNLSQEKVSELEISLQSAKNDRDYFQRELFAVSSKLAIMEEANRKNLDKIEELDAENSKLRHNVAGLESEMFAQGRRYSQLEHAYAQARDKIEQLTVNLEESAIRISQLESSYETAIREREDLAEELALSERGIAETKFLLQKTEDASNEVEQKMASMKCQMLKYEGQIESASKQKANLKAELEEERSKVSKLEKKLTKTQSQYEELQRNVDLNKKESSNKDKIIEDLRASVAAYELKTESLFSEITKLQTQMEITEEEKRALQDETLDAEKRILDVTADNRLSSEENEKLYHEIQRFYKRLSELQALYNTCEHEKYDFQHQTMALQQKVTKLEAELDEAVNQRSVYEVRVQEHTSTQNAINQGVAFLEAELLEQPRMNNDLHKDIAEREVSTKQLYEERDTLTVDSNACREGLKNMEGMRDMTEKEKKMLQNQLMIKKGLHSRVQEHLKETTLKRKEQLDAELSETQKRIANSNSSSERSVAAVKARELYHERSRSMRLAKELATSSSTFNMFLKRGLVGGIKTLITMGTTSLMDNLTSRANSQLGNVSRSFGY